MAVACHSKNVYSVKQLATRAAYLEILALPSKAGVPTGVAEFRL